MPFGELLVDNSLVDLDFRFSAKETDRESGLSYFGARYYDNTSAMWLGIDPLWEKYAGMNPYNYCAGNPVRLVDRDGREIKLDGEEDVVSEGFNQLNSSTSLDLSISNGKIYAEGSPVTEADIVLLEAIKSDVIVSLSLTNSLDYNGHWYVGGACNGSDIKKDGTIVASQIINPQMTSQIDETMGMSNGLTFLHEALEAYFMGRDHPGSGAPTFERNSIEYKNYYDAHGKAMAADPRFSPAPVTVFEETGEVKISKYDQAKYPIPFPDSWYKTINYIDKNKRK